MLGGCAGTGTGTGIGQDKQAQQAQQDGPAIITHKLAGLEKQSGGRLGLMAIEHAGGASSARIGYRENERFAFCSTFKVMLAGAILNRSVEDAGLLERRVRFGKSDLVTYSPRTEQAAGSATGLSVSQLCVAAMQYSDNTAGNLLIAQLGGIAVVNDYARKIGDPAFRLDRLETALNSATPGDERDTTTPLAMAQTLQKLALGELLPPLQRRMLVDWLRGNTTGGTRIRAAMPSQWDVGDKTGGGDYGTTNDVGVVWRGTESPVILSIYFTQGNQQAPMRADVVAAAAGIVREHFM